MKVTVKNRTPLTVPDRVRRRAGLKAGDRVEFKAAGGVITIRKLPSADNEYTPAQQRIIDPQLDQAEKGPFYGPFNTADDMIAHLKAGANKRRVKSSNAIDTSKPFPCFTVVDGAEPITLE
jgi:bifunctional DNA-binding transcriptional regulator/antitoxin component of YhaV-PrlF toxin-antitoxin module